MTSTSESNLVGVWWEHRSRRMDWALRAHSTFVDSLSEETREHLARGDERGEAYVVVFGRTQVGKTTLLLDLMGVSPEALSRVCTVLRGYREYGKSSTATAMEYRRSPDSAWRIDKGVGVERYEMDADLTMALASIRDAMSSRQLRLDTPVVVWVPEDCFVSGLNAVPIARMLDLPGDNPADDVEREHVKQMAQRYVPHADLILLVGRGDDLSFLRPDALLLPGIEDWQYVPNRFRIVTTYSFTPQSVRNMARSSDCELTPDLFRQRLLQQIETFGLSLTDDATLPNRFFPLEFGESWANAQRSGSELVARLGPIVDELKRQLHDDIRISATESARLRNALDVHVVANRKKVASLAEGQRKLDAIGQRFQRVSDDLKIAETERDHAFQLVAQAQIELEELPAVEWQREIEAMTQFDLTDQLAMVGWLDTNTDALIGRFDSFTTWLRQQFLAMSPSRASSRPRFWRHVEVDLGGYVQEVSRRISAEFSGTRAHLGKYWINEYYPSSSDSFSEDKTRLRRDMKDAARSVSQFARELWVSKAEQKTRELLDELQAVQGQSQSMATVASQLDDQLSRLASERQSVQADIESKVRKLDADAQSSVRFASMLNEEYLAELIQRRAEIESAQSPTQAFMTLLSAVELSDERSKIMIGIV